ncbi:MAG: helix-turn-helix domain-containing protein [Candidatus Aenigmarchaeota archaeon]|nr:helix-turn-helix domain-containing protein [Candidatus Aenigmarchaeota archaeon]MDI6722000.1 helix-turn-helix domain-containing protein [Candidatus Aenigmarchaeota archaeon]
MWNLPRGNEFLPTTPSKKLERLYRNEKDAKAKTRLLAALHRKDGKSIDKIAEIMHQKRPTVHDWLTKFNERGTDAKTDPKRPGKKPFLTHAQRKQLVKRLEKGPPHNPSGLWTSKEVRNMIHKQYGILYGKTNIWNILIATGFTLLTPRKKHYKSASIEEIEAFKKRLDEKQGTTERKVLLWPQKTKQHLA